MAGEVWLSEDGTTLVDHAGRVIPTGVAAVIEEVQDIIGAMVTGNTETNITVTYNDATGKLDFVASGGGGFSVPVTLTSTGTGVVPLVNQGFAGQVAALQQWKNSAGTTLSQITSDGYLITDAGMAVQRASGGDLVFWSQVPAAAHVWFYITTAGSLYWGSGLAAVDTSLAREAAGRLRTNGTFSTLGLQIDEQAAPATPPSGRGTLYFKTDGVLYTKNDAGTEAQLTTQADLDALPELAAADVTELQLVTTGGVTTATILAPIARTAAVNATNLNLAILSAYVNLTTTKIVGQYYMMNQGSLTPAPVAATLNSFKWYPKLMAAGTLDRMAIRVPTAEAAATVRLAIYGDNNGLPGTLIAECDNTLGTYPLDCSTTGVKEASITAVLPQNGKYWFGSVVQGASSALRLMGTADGAIDLTVPLGTTLPGFSTVHTLRHQSSVTGAAPANAASMSVGGGDNSQPTAIAFRYSA